MLLRHSMMTLALNVALIAATARQTAHADEIAPPPTPMQGGEALAFVESLADQPGGGEGEHMTIGKDMPGLVVRGRDGAETTTQVIELKTPKVTAPKYVIKGWIKYTGVAGDGYMESLNRFDGDEAFSRTLGDRGPMGKVTGDSGWRIFLLPFNAEPGMQPEHISVNVVLPGEGEVTITDVRLVQFSAAAGPGTAPAANAIEVAPKFDHGGGKANIASAARSEVSTPISLGDAKPMVLIYSSLIALLCSVVAAVVLLRRRRRRHETITSELRRMHALDAL